MNASRIFRLKSVTKQCQSNKDAILEDVSMKKTVFSMDVSHKKTLFWLKTKHS